MLGIIVRLLALALLLIDGTAACRVVEGSLQSGPSARLLVALQPSAGGAERLFSLRLPSARGRMNSSLASIVLTFSGAFQTPADMFQFDPIGGPPLDVELAAAGFIIAGPQSTNNRLVSRIYDFFYPAVPDLVPGARDGAFSRCSAEHGCEVDSWAQTTTANDPGRAAFDAVQPVDEAAFAFDVAVCARELVEQQTSLRVSSELFALGESQGAKIATFIGCAGAERGGFTGACVVGHKRMRGN